MNIFQVSYLAVVVLVGRIRAPFERFGLFLV